MSESPTTSDVETGPAFDWQRWPRKLNMGCGWDRREGYLNVDLHAFHEPDLVADVRDCPMLPSGEYDELIAEDILEHLPRADAEPALREWARLLRVGGHLVLRLPDLQALLRLFDRSNDPVLHAELVQCLYGTQAYDGDWHSNGFTEPLLRQALHDAGFDVVSIAHHDEWLFDVVARRTDQPAPLALAPIVPPATTASPVVTSLAIPVDSRLPGGRAAHRLVARAVRRQTEGVARQTTEALAQLSARVDELGRQVEQLRGEQAAPE